MINQLLEKLKDNPKSVFLIDGIGAVISAFLLGVVLVKLNRFFGIPVSTLYILASIPLFFIVYDFVCYKILNKNYAPYINAIAVMNLLYCVLSLVLAIHHADLIKILGWLYIITELIILAVMIAIEFKIARFISLPGTYPKSK